MHLNLSKIFENCPENIEIPIKISKFDMIKYHHLDNQSNHAMQNFINCNASVIRKAKGDHSVMIEINSGYNTAIT